MANNQSDADEPTLRPCIAFAVLCKEKGIDKYSAHSLPQSYNE